MKGKDCPAYGKKYHKCHKMNHFSSVCRSGSVRDQNSKRPNRAEEELKEELRRQLKMLNRGGGRIEEEEAVWPSG